MRWNRLRRGEWLAAASAVLLLVSLFLTWFGFPDRVFEATAVRRLDEHSTNAWETFGFLDLFLAFTVAVALTLAVVTAAEESVALSVGAAVATATISSVATLFVAYRLVNEPGDGTLDVEYGAILGLIAVVGIAAGAWLSLRDEHSPGVAEVAPPEPIPAPVPGTEAAEPPPPREPEAPAPPPTREPEPPAGGHPPP